MPDKSPLNARIWNRIERDGYTVKSLFQSLPNFYVSGIFFVHSLTRHPGVLATHGHAGLVVSMKMTTPLT